MIKTAIVGGSGYTGAELLRLMAVHPEVEVTAVTSRQDQDKPLTALFPWLAGVKNYDDLRFEAPDAAALTGKADMFFMATPHGTAMNMVRPFLDKGGRIVDLSADFRLRDTDVFKTWYQDHESPDLLAKAVYGLPELYRDQIKNASLVANPGCYPTSIILGLAPFLNAGLKKPDTPVIADSKSGVTGAGRGASLGTSFCETHDSFKAYKAVGHRHTPEIEQELTALCGEAVTASFTPHLLPVSRGILSTIYVQPKAEIDSSALMEIYTAFYKTSPFVRVRPQGFEPQTSEVRGSNFCDISVFVDKRARLVKIVSVIDNLCRGASGQAMVNFNLMCGFAEGLGVDAAPVRP